ncbi:MAG: PIN domain-containing protein [Candidatus Omnitrophica bacterium]|nr:PIN domain-containing protein [Candidatus Omnitrophota bacterium]
MIYLDTGAFIARYVQRDQYHRQALKVWERLAKGGQRCATSNFVLNEAFTLLARRAGYHFAAQRARAILSSQILTIWRPGEEEEHAAIDVLEKYADQQVSFTDCVSFVLMREHSVEEVFSFDSHFERAGFRLYQ